jgi:hypothetical protein
MNSKPDHGKDKNQLKEEQDYETEKITKNHVF